MLTRGSARLLFFFYPTDVSSAPEKHLKSIGLGRLMYKQQLFLQNLIFRSTFHLN